MYREQIPGAGALIAWAGQARGGGNKAVGFLIESLAGGVSGGGELGVWLDIAGSSTGGVEVRLYDDGTVVVSRQNTSAGESMSGSAGPALVAGSSRWLWVDIPTAMLAGTNPTVYYDGSGGWAAVTMSGASSPGGTADDLNGELDITIGELAAGDWKVGHVLAFQGVDRPLTAPSARAVALAANPITAALAYTGCCFAWNGANLTDQKFSATGVNTGGVFDSTVPLWTPSRRLVARGGLG